MCVAQNKCILSLAGTGSPLNYVPAHVVNPTLLLYMSQPAQIGYKLAKTSSSGIRGQRLIFHIVIEGRSLKKMEEPKAAPPRPLRFRH